MWQPDRADSAADIESRDVPLLVSQEVVKTGCVEKIPHHFAPVVDASAPRVCCVWGGIKDGDLSVIVSEKSTLSKGLRLGKLSNDVSTVVDADGPGSDGSRHIENGIALRLDWACCA